MTRPTGRILQSPNPATGTGSDRLVIFDCDGVLVDTEPITAEVSAAQLRGLGWDISPQEVLDRFLGCTAEYLEEVVEAHIGRGLLPGWDTELESLCHAAFAERLKTVAGVVQVLDALAVDEVPTCVASNGSHAKMRLTLGSTGLRARFAGRLFSADDVGRGKPAPDLYLHAAAVVGVRPDRCVVIEDSPRGVQAARAAGMACIGFAALTPADRLAGPGVRICTSMAEVLDELRGNPAIAAESGSSAHR